MDLRKIIAVNLRYNFLPHFLIALMIACLTPIVFNINSLNSRMSAQPLEMLLLFTGVFIMASVFIPEQDDNIRDVIRSKKFDYISVCIIRIIYSVLALAVITGGFVAVMHLCDSEVTLKHFIGGFASALFLGSIGFAVAGLSGNSVAGYMASMIYYAANIGLKDKLGFFYLFSMYSGDTFTTKYLLITASVIIIILTLIIKSISLIK